MIVLSEEEEKFVLRVRQLAQSKLVDQITVRIPDLAIIEKHSYQEEVFRPRPRIAALTRNAKQ